MAPSPLEIKTKALGRLIKEESLYHEEVQEQEHAISTMKSQNADPYDLKKQVEVLEDSKRMIPELRKKIEESLGSLEQFIREYTGDENLEDANVNIATAKKLLN
jgi:tubulin-specific chaperone A